MAGSAMDERYKVKECIGRGNYGTVYLVDSLENKKQYVLKRINFEHMPEKDRKHAMVEVEMLRTMDHPNIVKYKDHFKDEQNLYIIMGYCEGGDLHSKIKEASKAGAYFPEDQVLKWFVQMALALAYVHSHKVLHRDLKTQNIFLTRECKVIKLGDFGISKVLDGTIDMAKTVIGTPYYMSPELCENQPYGMQSDVWALGCILYEMCVLKHAFDATNICGLIFKILNGSYPPIGDKYSTELRDLVAQMLSREPKDRPTLNQILKMPLITRVMASLREDLSKGVKAKDAKAKTPKSPKKMQAKQPAKVPPKSATAVVGDRGRPGAVPAAPRASSASSTPKSVASSHAASRDSNYTARSTPSSTVSSSGLRAPTPTSTSTPTGKSSKEAVLERRRLKREADEKRLREDLKTASLENLKEKMAAKDRRSRMFQSSFAVAEGMGIPESDETGGSPPESSQAGGEEEAGPSEHQPTHSPSLDPHQADGEGLSPREEPGSTEEPQQHQVVGRVPRGVSLAGATTVSSDGELNASSLERTGSSMEEELPDALPIMDGHTLPRSVLGDTAGVVPEISHISPARAYSAPDLLTGASHEQCDESEERYDSDFEAYSSDFESDDENALSVVEVVKAEEAAPASSRDPTASEESAVHNPQQTEYYRTKILPLREKCEAALGPGKFEQVHSILRRRWRGECEDPSEVQAALDKIVPKSSMNAVFLVDQLIFCEEQGN